MELCLKVLSKEELKPKQLPRVLQRNDSQRVTDRTYFIDGSNQGMKSIPSEILALKELEELHLENNQISEIPQDIQNLKNVKVLYLRKNKLQRLYPELGLLSSLESQDLSGNPLLYSSLRVLSCLRALRELRPERGSLRDLQIAPPPGAVRAVGEPPGIAAKGDREPEQAQGDLPETQSVLGFPWRTLCPFQPGGGRSGPQQA